MKKRSPWVDLQIPSSIRSIVCLNLPSFSGGLNPWGTPNSNKQRDRDLTPPYVDDKLIEIVGFRDAWHGLILLAPNGHGTRLAQASRVRFEFHKGAADHTYMRIDGEPWKQPLPLNDDNNDDGDGDGDGAVVIEISHLGQASVLATADCPSRSTGDPSSWTSCSHHAADEDSDGDGDSPTAQGEEWKKFGAANTFRILEDLDVLNLS